jgi:hypothetical protein
MLGSPLTPLVVVRFEPEISLFWQGFTFAIREEYIPGFVRDGTGVHCVLAFSGHDAKLTQVVRAF